MPSLLLAAALALQSSPEAAPPEPAPLAQEDRALLRCAAAFALVARGQAEGEPAAKAWPDLATRGREFFVRALAQIMDTTDRDRAAIAALASAEAEALVAGDELPKVMPACLLMLEASGL
jgi:hypothetical protein